MLLAPPPGRATSGGAEEAYAFLVGAPVFKTGEGRHPVLAGSIPVRLRSCSDLRRSALATVGGGSAGDSQPQRRRSGPRVVAGQARRRPVRLLPSGLTFQYPPQSGQRQVNDPGVAHMTGCRRVLPRAAPRRTPHSGQASLAGSRVRCATRRPSSASRSTSRKDDDRGSGVPGPAARSVTVAGRSGAPVHDHCPSQPSHGGVLPARPMLRRPGRWQTFGTG